MAWAELGGRELRAQWLDESAGFHPEASQMLHAELLLLLAKEQPDEAIAVARAVVAMDEKASEKFDLGFSRILLARALIIANERMRALEVVNQVEDLLHAAPYPYLRSCTLELRGVIDAAGNGAQQLLEAADAFSVVLNFSDRARCLRIAGERLTQGGLADEAIAQLRSARDLAESSGARTELNRIDSLLRGLGIRPRVGRPRRSKDDKSLSPREAEIVALVAEGASNAEIGHRLFLSDRTIQDHIGHALKKLGLTSRAALASWAAKQGMV
jgi:DNA-binding NarL/FixJ family response regulator